MTFTPTKCSGNLWWLKGISSVCCFPETTRLCFDQPGFSLLCGSFRIWPVWHLSASSRALRTYMYIKPLSTGHRQRETQQLKLFRSLKPINSWVINRDHKTRDLSTVTTSYIRIGWGTAYVHAHHTHTHTHTRARVHTQTHACMHRHRKLYKLNYGKA